MLKQDFIQNTRLLLREEYEDFEAALGNEPPVSIRVNPWKVGAVGLPCREELFSGLEKILWCEMGRYLSKRPAFIFDPLFHAGVYYVQEAASMFLEQAIRTILADFGLFENSVMTLDNWGKACLAPTNPIAALDLCAAPGGKSTHLLALLPEDSLLVCNEVIRSRNLILAENIAKWGRPNVIVTQNDPQQFGHIPHFFDIILADLPCSGEGMFRIDPAARNEWSSDGVKLCASRQRRIIHDVWQALKPGGYLIYSTCTFNTEENEDNVTILSQELGAEIIPIPVKSEWNISGALCHNLPVYRFFPHRTRGEGFFLAILRKQTQSPTINRNKTKPEKQKSSPTLPVSIKNKLSNPEKFIFQNTGMIYAIPVAHESNCTVLSKHLKIISAGLLMGEIKGNDFIPATPLALSTEINIDTFPAVELSSDQAIAYLQRQAITLPADAPKGYHLITYQNVPLGFVKNIGPRANNLYPNEWRIRKFYE